MTPYELGVARAIADREKAIAELSELLAQLEARKDTHPRDIVRARATLEQLHQARDRDPALEPIADRNPRPLRLTPTEVARQRLRRARVA